MGDSVVELWNEFVASDLPGAADAADASYTAWAFGAGPDMADRLLSCVVDGCKRATCGSLRTYEHEGDIVPVPGDFSIVLDGAGVARCIIRTTGVEIVPFEEVGADFAAAEGEGDMSLESWRAGHWAYFQRELAGFGAAPSRDMPLVCERFEVVYPPLGR